MPMIALSEISGVGSASVKVIGSPTSLSFTKSSQMSFLHLWPRTKGSSQLKQRPRFLDSSIFATVSRLIAMEMGRAGIGRSLEIGALVLEK